MPLRGPVKTRPSGPGGYFFRCSLRSATSSGWRGTGRASPRGRCLSSRRWRAAPLSVHQVPGMDYLGPPTGVRPATLQGLAAPARELARWLGRRGTEAYVQPPDVFTGDEVRRLFAAIDSQAMSSYSNKAMVDPVLFRVLYGAGLRVSEALSLTLADVDTRGGTLRIRDSKN